MATRLHLVKENIGDIYHIQNTIILTSLGIFKLQTFNNNNDLKLQKIADVPRLLREHIQIYQHYKQLIDMGKQLEEQQLSLSNGPSL